MMHSYSFVGLTRILTIHSLMLIVFFVSARNAPSASDHDTLEYIANKIDSNYEGIYLWQGSAVIQVTTNQVEPAPDFPKERYTKYEYRYAFDKAKGDYFSSALLLNEYSIYDKIKKYLLISNKSFMSKDGICYSIEWYNDRKVPVVSVKDNVFLPEYPNEIARIAYIHKKNIDMTKQPYQSFLFNPFEKYSSDILSTNPRNRTSAIMEIREILNGMDINKASNLSESLSSPNSHPDDIARLVTKENKITLTLRHTNQRSKNTAETNYVFDAEQGYNVITHNCQIIRENKIIQKQQRQCSYTLVDGFWVPKKTEMNDDFPNMVIKQIIDWTSHQINKPIPDSTFTLQNMGVCRGDQLYDERTETKTIISGDDFPAPPHHKENIRFSVTRYVLIALGSVMILAALFNMYRKRQADRKEVT